MHLSELEKELYTPLPNWGNFPISISHCLLLYDYVLHFITALKYRGAVVVMILW